MLNNTDILIVGVLLASVTTFLFSTFCFFLLIDKPVSWIRKIIKWFLLTVISFIYYVVAYSCLLAIAYQWYLFAFISLASLAFVHGITFTKGRRCSHESK